jgi:hypothetical protein
MLLLSLQGFQLTVWKRSKSFKSRRASFIAEGVERVCGYPLFK